MRDIASPLDGFASPFGPVRRSLRAMLFGAGEPGFTFEPWDITTLYQDRAGTTPVTAAGQSVGLRLDKSKGLALGAENSTITGAQTRTTTGAVSAWNTPPVVGRFYVIDYEITASTWTGDIYLEPNVGPFSYVVLAKTVGRHQYVFPAQDTQASSTIQMGGASPTGSVTFARLSVRELAGNHEVAINDAARGIYGWMPKTGRRNLLNATDTLATQSVTVTAAAHTLAFTGTGTVVLSGAHVGTLIGTGASDRVTLTFTPLAVSLTLTVTGSVTLAQLELGSTDTAYQRVVSNYDVAEAGVPSCYYVLANGVNTAYVTPTITPNTDKVQVFAAVRKNSDAAAGMFVETSATASTNAGTMYITAPELTGATGDFRFKSRGSINTTPVASGTMLAPTTKILTGLGDISGDTMTMRVNGTQVAQSTADQGTGNFLAYPAYIYARGGTTLPFNGYDFGHAVRFGPNLDAATIARVEALIARNTPEVTL